jgi:hypothetical protein
MRGGRAGSPARAVAGGRRRPLAGSGATGPARPSTAPAAARDRERLAAGRPSITTSTAPTGATSPSATRIRVTVARRGPTGILGRSSSCRSGSRRAGSYSAIVLAPRRTSQRATFALGQCPSPRSGSLNSYANPGGAGLLGGVSGHHPFDRWAGRRSSAANRRSRRPAPERAPAGRSACTRARGASQDHGAPRSRCRRARMSAARAAAADAAVGVRGPACRYVGLGDLLGGAGRRTCSSRCVRATAARNCRQALHASAATTGASPGDERAVAGRLPRRPCGRSHGDQDHRWCTAVDDAAVGRTGPTLAALRIARWQRLDETSR